MISKQYFYLRELAKCEYYYNRALRGKSELINSKIRVMNTSLYESKMKERDDRYKRYIDKSGPVIDLRLKYGKA